MHIDARITNSDNTGLGGNISLPAAFHVMKILGSDIIGRCQQLVVSLQSPKHHSGAPVLD